MLLYLSMLSDTSSLFSASVCFCPLSLSPSRFFYFYFFHSWSVKLFTFCSLFWFLSLQFARLHSVTLVLTHRHSPTEISRGYLSCAAALSGIVDDCGRFDMYGGRHTHTHSQERVHVGTGYRECLQKCEIKYLKQLHLSRCWNLELSTCLNYSRGSSIMLEKKPHCIYLFI